MNQNQDSHPLATSEKRSQINKPYKWVRTTKNILVSVGDRGWKHQCQQWLARTTRYTFANHCAHAGRPISPRPTSPNVADRTWSVPEVKAIEREDLQTKSAAPNNSIVVWPIQEAKPSISNYRWRRRLMFYGRTSTFENTSTCRLCPTRDQRNSHDLFVSTSGSVAGSSIPKANCTFPCETVRCKTCEAVIMSN